MSAKNFEKKNKKNETYGVQNTQSSDEDTEESWFANGLHRFIIIFSVIYFAIVLSYITFNGWDNLFSMLPNEFSGYMAGIILPIAIVWVVMAYIDRGSNYKHETQMLRDSLNQVIFPDSGGNAASKMIAEAIKTQVAELKDVTRDACAQADVIKRDLTDRVSDLKQLVSALDNYSSQAMQDLNVEVKKLVDNFSFVADKAATVSSDFRVNSMQMKDDSEKLVNIIKPMVNEMVTAAERVKEVVDVSNANIEKAQSQLHNYSETSQIAIGKIIESWAEKGENLEKTFLRTAENCEELFRRLDSGISHIESSVAEQKAIVDKQSDLLDKNTVYLDNKLGEYGKLISLEVEAMIERSGTLEHNLQSQMNGIRETAEGVTAVFSKLGTEVVNKRKIVEAETLKITENIKNTVQLLNSETKHLKDFYAHSSSKNEEFATMLTELSDKLRDIELGLNVSASTFGENSEKLAVRLQNTGDNLAQSLNQMSQNSLALSEQSKTNAGLLIEQDEYVNKALAKLKQISTEINSVNKALNKTSDSIGNNLSSYETKISEFGNILTSQLKDLNESYSVTKEKIDEFSLADFSASTEKVVSGLQNTGNNITQIMNSILHSSETIREQSKTNSEILVAQDEYVNKAMTKLKQISTGLGSINKDLSKTGENIGNTLNAYENKMSDFSKSLNVHLEELEQSYEKTKIQLDKINLSNIDSFMRDSSTVLSELETLSIDITNIFNRKGDEEELWKKYYAGDHGAFTRYLAKNITKKELKALQDSYENKPDFRVILDKYMEDFEALISAAKDNARSGTVLALISGSDIGKVYYIMARALGKIQ